MFWVKKGAQVENPFSCHCTVLLAAETNHFVQQKVPFSAVFLSLNTMVELTKGSQNGFEGRLNVSSVVS